MNLIALSWHYIKSRPYNTALNVLLLGLGIGIIVILLILSRQVEEKLVSNAKKINLVVGAKGSPMQLILSSIFHIDYPTGNIPLEEANMIAKNRYVANAIPLALGDSYKTFRIVGTNHDYPDLYEATLQEGRLWSALFEVTLGARVAQSLGLHKGDQFYGQHGMAAGGHAHEEVAYTVVGILAETHTVLDNLILTKVESIWVMHDHALLEKMENAASQSDHSEEHHHLPASHSGETNHQIQEEEKALTDSFPITSPLDNSPLSESSDLLQDKEITSLLITYRSPMAAIHLPRMVNSKSSLQAASPAFETARLFAMLGMGVQMIQGLAGVIILIAGISIFIALYNELKQRKYDLAIMRSLGASRRKVFVHVVLEGLLITLLGTLAGLLLGHGALELLSNLFSQSEGSGMDLSGWIFVKEEWMIIGMSILLGVLAAFIPAWRAYQTDISTVLAKR